MKTLLLTTLALSLAVAGPDFASAGGNKGKKSGGGNFSFNQYSGGNSNRLHHNSYVRTQSCNSQNYNRYPSQVFVSPGYEPFHSYYYCQPGDTLSLVSMREYGTSGAMRFIASYNRLAMNTALVPGQVLMLPSVSRTGVMSASRAPAPENLAAPQTAAPASEASFAPSVDDLPSVMVGSKLSLDDVEFGNASGSVRLKIGPMSVPVTVTEWTAKSVKVQLPTVDLETATPASLDVFKADGSIASQSGVKLMPAGTQLAKAAE